MKLPRCRLSLIINSVVLAFLISVGMADPASGDLIIQPSAISSPQGEHPSFPLVNIINQSSLFEKRNGQGQPKPTSYISGVTDFVTFTNETEHISVSGEGAGTTNTELSVVSPQQMTFDLGASMNVNGVAMWGLRFGNQITQFELFSDDDGDFFNGPGSQLGTFDALTQNDPNPAQVFSFDHINTRYLHMNILGADMPTRPGTGEIAFRAAVPEPSSFLFLGLICSGLLGQWIWKKW